MNNLMRGYFIEKYDLQCPTREVHLVLFLHKYLCLLWSNLFTFSAHLAYSFQEHLVTLVSYNEADYIIMPDESFGNDVTSDSHCYYHLQTPVTVVLGLLEFKVSLNNKRGHLQPPPVRGKINGSINQKLDLTIFINTRTIFNI